jgi:hypothetical protein
MTNDNYVKIGGKFKAFSFSFETLTVALGKDWKVDSDADEVYGDELCHNFDGLVNYIRYFWEF